MEVQFIEGEPPDGHGKYGHILVALMARPGVWAIVDEVSVVGKSGKNPGMAGALRNRGLIVAQRKSEDGKTVRIYAMYPAANSD